MKNQIRKSLRFVALLICSFTMLAAQAQALEVRGTVCDENNEPLIGATVAVKGTNVAAATDIDGNFFLKVPDAKSVLKATYVGYEPQEVAVNGRNTITIIMKSDSELLDEVVVVGYGVQKKVTMTGSVSAVSSKELLKAPMTNVSNLLTGKVSGLTSIQSSGQPGADQTTMYVRGANGFLDYDGGGGKSPLVIVDGVERSMNFVNPNDIESVSVLKDAAASIYGVKGANGVILITTKKGDGQAVISYGASFTLTRNTAFPEHLNAAEFMYYHNRARELDGLTPMFTADIQQKVMTNDPNSVWGQTDWFDKVFRTGFTQQHNVTASGGTSRVKYFTSLGYMGQDGTIRNSDYSRFNVRANLDIAVAKNLTFATTLSGYRTEMNAPGVPFGRQYEFNPIRQASNTAPVIKPEWNGLPTAWTEGTYNVNPIAALERSGSTKQRHYAFNSTFKLEYDFSGLTSYLKGLKVSLFAAYDFGETLDRNLNSYYTLWEVSQNDTSFAEGEKGATGFTKGGSFNRSSSNREKWIFRPQLEYFRDFGKNSLGVLFLYEAGKVYNETMTSYARGFIANDPIDISLGTDWENIPNPTGSHNHESYVSYVGRLNYAWDNKYLAEFAFRYDGSYVFAPENRWGFFPSASIGWVASRENFLKDVQWLDFLKLRASYGEAGDDGVTPFLYNSHFALSNDSYIMGGKPMSQIFVPDKYIYQFRALTWATTKSYNIGLETTVLRNRLSAEVDVFYRKTVDILEKVTGQFPPSLGNYFPSHSNSGELDNRGVEVTLKHNLAVTRDFSYNIRGTFSWARNKVLKKKVTDNVPNYRAQIGESMGARYGLHATGLFQTQEQLDNYPQAPSGFLRLGDIMYQDINGDGKISRDFDYVKIGYGQIPEINFSLGVDLNYRDFYLSMLWQGVTHCDYALQGIYDNGMGHTAATVYTSSLSGGNSPKYLIEGAWTPENPDAKYPRLSTTPNGNNAWESDWWIINGEYLRLKNFQVGYNVPENILRKTPFSRLNVYVAGTNVLTFSHFKYMDPESPSVSNGCYPQSATWSLGLNVSF